MKNKIITVKVIGFVFVSLLGTWLHFLYEWTDKSPVIAPFSGVNESTWEHMKLFFVPAFLFAVAERFLFKDRIDFWRLKLKGILFGILLIPAVYYFYNCVIGKSPDWLNIAIFFISVFLSFALELKLFLDIDSKKRGYKSFIAIILISIAFTVFTFFTPKLAIFQDPITGLYGI